MLGKKTLLKKLQLIVLGLAVGGLLLPIPAMARRNNRSQRSRFANPAALGRAALNALLFGRGRIARRLGIRSKVNQRRIQNKVNRFRRNPDRAARGVTQARTRGQFADLSRNEALVRAAERNNLSGRNLNPGIHQSITTLVENLGGDRFLSRLGRKINRGDLAGVRGLMDQIQAELDQMKARVEGQILNATAVEIETVAFAVLIFFLFLIDFNFQPQDLSSSLGQQQQLNQLVTQFTGAL